MEIKVNGELYKTSDPKTLLELLEELQRTEGVAVAVDHAVIPKQEWAEYKLSAGVEVELIQAVQGG